ncbi:MAG: tetratricopeptide repeat protein [bacterium]|nr:tetratricopeptide repeat protein [bacterium]
MENPEYYYKKGLGRGLQDDTGAVEDYSKAIDLNPSYIDAYIRRGMLYYKLLKKYEEALADLDQAVKLAPHRADALLERGIVNCHLLKFDDALKDLTGVIQLNPYDEKAYLNRGKVKYVLKYDKKEVCKDLEMAIRLGAPHAADMIKIFYGQEQAATRDSIDEAIKDNQD